MPTETTPKKTAAKKAPAKKAAAKKAPAKKAAAVVVPAPAVPAEVVTLAPLRIMQLGNFVPPHSTENHLYRALVGNGHDVARVQETSEQAWLEIGLVDRWPIPVDQVDLIIWTKTDTPETLGRRAWEDMQSLLEIGRMYNIPIVAYHLDLWWGLKREHQVHRETIHPFFECPLVITADGGHDELWAAQGINHVWFPPGVSRAECELGSPDPELSSPLAFVGSWDGGYHQEHEHRMELVRWLRRNFRRDCAFWPRPGEAAIRGDALRDLYASVDIVIGDSCFAGTLPNYWSDRIPETLGRGGFLLHPNVPGLNGHFHLDEDLVTWQAGEWDQLGSAIEVYLGKPERRKEIAASGRAAVLEDHTYETRMLQLHRLLVERGML